MILLMDGLHSSGEWTSQMTSGLISIPFFILLYLFRKVFPFNMIWYFLMGILIYAGIGFAKKKVKEWWEK